MDKLEEILCNLIDDVSNFIYEDKTVLSTASMLDIIEKSKTKEKIIEMIRKQTELRDNTKRPILHGQAETFLYCSLDEQQCRDSCEHKNDRINCPCVTVTNKKRDDTNNP